MLSHAGAIESSGAAPQEDRNHSAQDSAIPHVGIYQRTLYPSMYLEMHSSTS